MKILGAGWDARPLTLQHIRDDHDLILYVDALPNVPHYEPGQVGYPRSISEEAIMGALAKDGGHLFVETPRKGADSWTVALEDDVTLRYFFNVKDVDISHNEALAALLPSVVTMWIAGFAPDPLVFSHVPRLETAYATIQCADELPAGVEHVLIKDGEFQSDGEFVEYPSASDDDDDDDE